MLQLSPNERIIQVLRPSWRTFYVWYIFVFLLCSAMSASGSNDLIFFVIVMVAIGIIMMRARYQFFITNQRVLMRVGLITRNTNEMSIRHIRGMNVRQNLVERLLGFGRVEIISAADGGAEVIFTGISNPQGTKEIIRRI